MPSLDCRGKLKTLQIERDAAFKWWRDLDWESQNSREHLQNSKHYEALDQLLGLKRAGPSTLRTLPFLLKFVKVPLADVAELHIFICSQESRCLFYFRDNEATLHGAALVEQATASSTPGFKSAMI